MEIAPAIATPTQRLVHLWRIRWRLTQRAWKEFGRQLLGHPVALAGGIIFFAYLLGAVFAPQITPPPRPGAWRPAFAL